MKKITIVLSALFLSLSAGIASAEERFDLRLKTGNLEQDGKTISDSATNVKYTISCKRNTPNNDKILVQLRSSRNEDIELPPYGQLLIFSDVIPVRFHDFGLIGLHVIRPYLHPGTETVIISCTYNKYFLQP